MLKNNIILITAALSLMLLPNTAFPKSDPPPTQPAIVATQVSKLAADNKPAILETVYKDVVKEPVLSKVPTEIPVFEGYSPAQLEKDEIPAKFDRFKKPIFLVESTPLPLEIVLKKIAAMVNVDLVIKEDVDRRVAVKPEIKNQEVYKALRDILSRIGCSYRLSDNALTVFKFEQRRFNIVMGPIDYTHRATISSENKTSVNTSSTSTTTTSEEKPKMGSSTHVESTLEITFWKELDANVAKMISKEGWYSLNKSEGIIIVKDYPAVLDEIATYLETVNSYASRQVLVEAKIVEVTLSQSHAWGIDWNEVYKGYGKVNQVTTGISLIQDVVDSNTLSVTGSGSQPGAGVTAKGVQGILQALEQQGDVNVVSQPKVLLLNNIPGNIQVVTKIPYISQVTQSISNTADTTSYSVTTDEVLKGVTLEMSAKIIDKDNIYLNLTPIVKDLVSDNIPEKTFGAITVQLPQTTDRALTTTVKVKSGETIIIGGLIQNSEEKSSKAVPVISKIPFIGYLFKSESKTKKKTEIVMVLTPTLAN